MEPLEIKRLTEQSLEKLNSDSNKLQKDHYKTIRVVKLQIKEIVILKIDDTIYMNKRVIC